MDGTATRSGWLRRCGILPIGRATRGAPLICGRPDLVMAVACDGDPADIDTCGRTSSHGAEQRVPCCVPAQAWAVLTDVERIAPCMPGAQLQEVEGDEYRGIVKVKVGPDHRAVQGQGHLRREGRGRPPGRAAGRGPRHPGPGQRQRHHHRHRADGDGTKVTVVTDLTVTGKVAQFGRGVLADVSAKLLNQFVECLEARRPGGRRRTSRAAGRSTVRRRRPTSAADQPRRRKPGVHGRHGHRGERRGVAIDPNGRRAPGAPHGAEDRTNPGRRRST